MYVNERWMVHLFRDFIGVSKFSSCHEFKIVKSTNSVVFCGMAERGAIFSWQLRWILSRVTANLGNRVFCPCQKKKKAKTIFYLFGFSMTVFEVLICHAKVGHFAHIVVIKEDVSSCQVTMDYLPKDKDPKCKLANKCMSFVRPTMIRGKIIQTFAWVVRTIVPRVFITDQNNCDIWWPTDNTKGTLGLMKYWEYKTCLQKIHII